MKVMRIALTNTYVLVCLCALGSVGSSQIAPDQEIAGIVSRSQEALNVSDEKVALGVVKDGLNRFPTNEELCVQLAAVYAFQHRDSEAIAVLQQVIRANPSSRAGRLKMAQVRGYRGEYEESDRLYHELLAANPDDETAALGLGHNLVLEGKREEARHVVQEALQRHPASLLLQQYNDSLAKIAGGREVRPETTGRVQATESFFADSSGNRSVDSFQSIFYQFKPGLSSRLRVDETALWRLTTPMVTVVSADDELRARVNKFVAVRGSGGAVRYADGRNKWIGSGDLDLFPVKSLTISGGYSRYPVIPTFDSTLFDLSSEGWHTRLSYGTKNFSLNGTFFLTHYSDGNRGEREWGEALRWMRLSETVSFGAGYAVRHFRYMQELDHGYFSPLQYWSQLGAAGLRGRIGRHYHGELLLYGGAETQDGGAYTPAGEASLKNDFNFGHWNVGADYSYYHLAQATGAFHANGATLSLAYKF
jgi:tetratricopeptide (TPR) repeat protein